MTPKGPIERLFCEDEDVDFQPAPSLAHFHNLYVLPGSREIHIIDEISDEDGSWFTRCVRWLEGREDGWRSIRVVLNTPGGDVESMFAIHDAMRSTPCAVEVLAVGQVCSAGVLLLACGDRRLVTENLVLMSHESHGGGDAELGFRASKDRRKYEDWQHNRWCELMGRYSPPDKDGDWWKRNTRQQAEYWLLGGAKIVEAGLADEVVEQWPKGVPDFQSTTSKDPFLS